TGVWGNPSGLPGGPERVPIPWPPLTLNPPQVSGSLRQKAVPGTASSELQELQSRTERAERRLLACENLVGELGSGLAALGTVLQGYGQLQQRLLNLENLLKNRNFWILRLPPTSRGEIPKVAAAASPGSYYAVSKPDILSRIERDEELSDKEGQELPWTQSGDGQEPLQAAEEMDKADEAPGDETLMEAAPDGAKSKPNGRTCIKRDEEISNEKGPEPSRTQNGDSQKTLQIETGDSQEPPETQTGNSPKSPRTRSGNSQKTPQTQTRDSQNSPQAQIRDSPKSSWTRSGNSQKTPQTQTGDNPPQTHTRDSPKSSWTRSGNSQKILQTQTEDSQKTPWTQTGDSPKSTWTRSGNSQKILQTQTEDSQKTPQTQTGDNPPQTHTRDSPKSSWTRSGNSQKTLQIQTEDSQNPPQTQTGDSPKSTWTRSGNSPKSPRTQTENSPKSLRTQTGNNPKSSRTQSGNSPKLPWTQIGNSPKSPQAHTGDSQTLPQTQTGDPQTGVPNNQKPPQTPEEMEQQEEALGEDPMPTEAGPEFPILMMNVMSLGDHQPGMVAEEDLEMEEDPAEPDTGESPCAGDTGPGRQVGSSFQS
ncbi:zinc finger family member 783, partial [Lamprotornis superbus]